MEITPLQAFYGSMMIVMLAALLTIVFRQGQSPTRKEMHDLHQQLREELRAEIREAVNAAVREICADMSRQIEGVNHRIDALEESVNHRIDALEASVNHRIDAVEASVNHRIDALEASVNHRIDSVNYRIDALEESVNYRMDGLRQDITRVLNALANHEHIDGRVMITAQPDAEPSPAVAADN